MRPEETEIEPKWERKRVELLQGMQYHDAMSFRPKIQKTLLQRFLGGKIMEHSSLGFAIYQPP